MRRPRLFRSILGCVVVVTGAATAMGGEMLHVDDPMPEFALPAHDGTTVSSEELAGAPYLVYFYPKADTPGCTTEACAFRDSWDDVEATGLAVLGVSFDSPEVNKAFAEKYNLPFRLLSDTDRELAKAVGATRALLPVPKRISYLVGADGRVLAAYPDVRPARHAGEVLADWERLRPAGGG